MVPTDTDRNLLFGLLALQNGLIDQGALITAFAAWMRDKSRPLADHLVTLGHLDAARRAVVEAMAGLHVQAVGGDIEKSLAVLAVGRSTCESLAAVTAGRSSHPRRAGLGEPEVAAILALIDRSQNSPGTGTDVDVDDPDRTASYSVGRATSDGQRFRIVRPHARGGLGAVFVALDNELHREVALKQILESHADDAGSRQRFVAEAEITGGLEHPGVVPVYGLGADGGGRPYYAMRFIKGDSLKEAIARFHEDDAVQTDPGRRSLELRTLLRRFTDVCNAIDYAHSRGVIHRDIKPSNIIVGKYGETLVVDWGLAKAIGRVEPGTDSGERALVPSSTSGSAETVPGSAMGTPAYMSPEQAEGQLDRLGRRSDIYSLGATLYCLLTGKPPFTGHAVDVIPAVQRGDSRPPRQLDLSIDPALEAICLKAMAHKPEDRYASSRALADDLDRWMADEPVTAWREPFARSARRWARRNRTAVTAAAVALVAGVVGLSAVLAVQTRAKADLAASNAELRRSRAAVQARYKLAVEAIGTFHTGVCEDFLLRQNQFKEVRDALLKSASDFYGKLGALLDKESDPASRRALWQANYEVAELTGKVGKPADALAAHRQVLTAREALASESPADPEIKADVGRSLTAVARLLEATGQTREAQATYRKAETLLVEVAPTIAEAAAARAVLANCRSRLGGLLRATGRNDDALLVLRLARADQESLTAVPEATAESRRDLADTINRVANLLAVTGKSLEAEVEYRKSLTIVKKLADDNPAVADFRSRLALAHNNLGLLLGQTDKTSEALAEYRKSLAIFQKLADDNPAVPEFRGNLANVHNGIGILLMKTSESSDAEAEFRWALAIRQKLSDDNPAITRFRANLADSHNNLGLLLVDTGKLSDAEAEYRNALALSRKLTDDNPAVTGFRGSLARNHFNLGLLLTDMGKTSEAAAEHRAALALFQNLVDDNLAVIENRIQLAGSHIGLGLALHHTGKAAEARSEYLRALEIQEKLADENPAVIEVQRELALTLVAIGWQLAQAGKTGGAIGYYTRGAAIRQRLAEASSATSRDKDALAHCQTNMVDALRRLGRLDEALADCERALAVRENLVTAHPEFPDYRAGLGVTYLRLGQVRHDLRDVAGSAAAWRRACAHYDAIKSLNGEHTFWLACCHAGLAGLAGRPGTVLSATEGANQADRAMAVLHQALTMGYRNSEAYRTESALDPLRDRPDFQMLMMDIAMPARPFAE